MAGINSEIETLKKEIEKTQQGIETLYLELGEVAAKWHKQIGYEPSNDAFIDLCQIIKEKDDIENQMDALHGAIKEVNYGDQEIAKTQLSMRDLDNHYNILIASFGAVASEVQSDNRFPDNNLYECLEPVRVFKKKLVALETKRASLSEKASQFAVSSIEKKIAKHKATLNEVFFETGKRLLSSGNYKLVPGQRALAIIHEMEEIKNLRHNYHGLIKKSETNITKAQGELKNMGAYGDESKTIRNLEAKDKQLLGQLEIKFAEYGKVLALGMSEWLSPEAPRELRDVCSRINVSNALLMQQNLHIDYLMLDKEIEVHKSQSAALMTQIEHLSNQRLMIDKQIAGVQAKIEEEKAVVAEMRQQQNYLSIRAEQLSKAN